MTGRLWLIGGTQESRWLVDHLQQQSLGPGTSLLVTVTTEAARNLYQATQGVTVWVGQLTSAAGSEFIQAQQIRAILDMSHPFATAISALAIALAQQHHLPYLRYERPAVSDHPQAQWLDQQGRPGNVTLPTLATLFTEGYLNQERTLLTLGYRCLPEFRAWQFKGVLFARILPSEVALKTVLEAGFTPARIIALRPPLSAALEKALWQQWAITQVVTKASGQPGGEVQKQAIAAELGIRLIRLPRPPMAYPNQTTLLEEALEFALSYVN